METVRLLYKELFTIQFAHAGYGLEKNVSISDSIRIRPDNETAVYTTNYNIGCRFYGDKFFCFIRTRLLAPPAVEPVEPYIKNTDETRLRFLMYSSTDFISKTFAVNAGGKWVYQFSNKTNNVEGADPDVIFYLSEPIDSFINAKDYLTGTIVENAGHLFAALKTARGTDNIPITNVEYWLPLNPAQQLVNNKDLKTIDEAGLSEKSFGIIDIHYSGTADSYKLFGNAGELLSPVYNLTFKSRT